MTPLPSRMTRAQFVAAFAAIYENSPWVAAGAYDAGIGAEHDSPQALAAAMAQVVQNAAAAKQQALIMEHPVLGAKKKMGAYSVQEQRQANLTTMAADEAETLQRLNADYMAKFNMPFIMAVKGADTAGIISALQRRLQHDDAAAERSTALAEIHKIARFRLEALWEEPAMTDNNVTITRQR